MKEVDGAAAECETARGCRIPPLGVEEARVLRMRSMLVRLQGLVDAPTVLSMFGATREDIELLAEVEDELREHEKGG